VPRLEAAYYRAAGVHQRAAATYERVAPSVGTGSEARRHPTSILATASRGLMNGTAHVSDIAIVLAVAAALTAVFVHADAAPEAERARPTR